jgi:hypothetical protein
MNKKQKFVVWFSLFLFIITCLASPWNVGRQITGTITVYTASVEFGPVFASPQGYGYSFIQLAWPQLLCEWLAIGTIASTLVYILKPKTTATTPALTPSDIGAPN